MRSAGRALEGFCCQACHRLLSGPWEAEQLEATPWPIYVAGPYGGPHRNLILAAKDRHITAAIRLMGGMIATGVQTLTSAGAIADPRMRPLTLIPAPSRPASAKQRGGDVVTRALAVAQQLLPGNIAVVQVAHIANDTPDSAGLGRQARRGNLAGSIIIDPQRAHHIRNWHRGLPANAEPSTIVMVDDIITTGATMTQFGTALAGWGITTHAALALARS